MNKKETRWFKLVSLEDYKISISIKGDYDNYDATFHSKLEIDSTAIFLINYSFSKVNSCSNFIIHLKKDEEIFLRLITNSDYEESNFAIKTFLSHDHIYTYKYAQYSSTKHYCYCECGDKILNAHTIIVDSNNNNECNYCGYSFKNGGVGIVVPSL